MAVSFSSIGKVKIGFSEEEYLGPCHKIVPNVYIFSFRFMTTALKWKIPGSFYCILTLPNVLFIKRHSSWKILEKASCNTRAFSFKGNLGNCYY